MKIKKNTFRNLIALILFLCLLLPCAAAPEIQSADKSQPELTEGTYRIRNLSNSFYMGVYKYNSRYAYTSYVKAGTYNSGDLGECFELRYAGNGCWQLVSTLNNADYFVSCSPGTAAGSKVAITKTNDKNCLFDITYVGGGAYTIAPSYSDNIRAVISESTEKNSSDYYLKVSDYKSGTLSQLWVFEPITTTGITVAYTQTKLKLYTTDRFYAALQPSGESATDAKWTSSDENVLLIGDDGSYCTLAEGTVTITVTAEGHSAHFDVQVVNSDCFTWYSQNNISGSDWDATLVAKQRWYAEGTTKYFMCDSKSQYNYDNWMDIGCAECCAAMVLHNLGATTKKGFDIRTGQQGGLAADPYTVALANSGNLDMITIPKVIYGNPVYVAWRYISDAFYVDGEEMTYAKYYTQNKAKIRDLLQKHPQGVIASMDLRNGGSHYIVIAKCLNPQEKNTSKLEFLYYDPAGYLPEEADCVPFESTTAYVYMSYRFVNIGAIIVYDTVSKLS